VHGGLLSLAAARAMLWIDAVHGNARAAHFAKDCLRAYFAEGIDITSDDELLRLADGLGVDPAVLLVGIKSPEAKEMFQRASNAALEKGVFGSPFVLVDGEPFWGFDHFDQLEACLAGQYQR
jgi:2-hydroxychromene-2-carboxylate isomerase